MPTLLFTSSFSLTPFHHRWRLPEGRACPTDHVSQRLQGLCLPLLCLVYDPQILDGCWCEYLGFQLGVLRGKYIRDLRGWVPFSRVSPEGARLNTLISCIYTPSLLPLPCPPPSYDSGSPWVSPFPTQMACQKRPSGHLVSVLSGSEASFVASLVKNSVNSYSYVWMGLHDPTEVCTHFSS